MSRAWRVAWVVALGLGLGGWGAETVCPDGCPFARVQDALAAAEPGATVLIGPGTYPGDVWVRKPVTLQAEGAGPVVLGGTVYVLGTTQVTLQGLTVREGGIRVEDSSGVLISRCTVEGPGGIVIRSSSVSLRDTVVRGAAGHGVLVTLGSRALIADSTVRDSAGDGIHVAASMADIRTCEVHGNAGYGIWADESSTIAGQSTLAAVTGNSRGTLGGNARALDRDPPPAPLSLVATPADWTAGEIAIRWAPPEDLTGVAAAWYRIGTRPATADDGVRAVTNPFVIENPPEGRHTVYVWLEDGAGNRSDKNLAEVAIASDRTPPAGRVVVEGGARHVFAPQVALTLEAADRAGTAPGSGVSSMRLSNDGRTWAPWQPFQERLTWDLTQAGGSAAPGKKRIVVELRDGAGNVGRAEAEVTLVRTLPSPEAILSLAVTPDGTQLVQGLPSGAIRVVDLRTGQEGFALAGHTGPVNGLAISPDGRTLASGSQDNTVRVWSVATGKEVRTLRGHTGGVWAVAFSPDGKSLASASSDGTVRTWDVATGRALRTISAHTGPVRAVAFSPDGKTLASGGDDRTVALWETSTGRQRRLLAEHTGSVRALAFSPDGALLASAGLDGKVALWDLASGKVARTMSLTGAGFRAVAFSPDGKSVAAAASTGRIPIWDRATGGEVEVLVGPSAQLNALVFVPGGNALVSGGEDKAVRLWELGP